MTAHVSPGEINFSKSSYCRIIERALRAGYVPTGFQADALPPRALFLRHDVDISMERALEMASWNEALGVCGTFFLLTRSPHYNLAAEYELDLARGIQAAGQRLGLHITTPEAVSSADLERVVAAEFSLMRELLPGCTPVFAWHNTRKEVLEAGSTLSYDGCVNVYSPRFFRETPYYSDTHMRYSPEDWLAIVDRGHERLHALFHPVIWTSRAADPIAMWASAFDTLIRRHERDIRGNVRFSHAFPEGLPQDVIDRFTQALLAAARR